MANFDLNSMSLKELKSLQVQVARALNDFEGRSRRVAIAALEDLAKQKGYSLVDLVGTGAGPRKRAPATEKYRNQQ